MTQAIALMAGMVRREVVAWSLAGVAVYQLTHHGVNRWTLGLAALVLGAFPRRAK